MAKTHNFYYYLQQEFGSLVGKTVQAIRDLTPEELENLGWEPGIDDGMVIHFTDGTLLVPMRDPEGNGPGFPLMEVPE
jgi:hypothetical protein